jgi:N-hydroxyarylamine O-acetyltransferase
MSRQSVAAENRVPEDLLERVLTKLGFSSKPVADRAGLDALYAAWCRGVPFDNTRKLIHLRANDPGPLPGDSPTDFLEAWLEHGAGGTCWAVHGALTSVLATCGFDARRGIGTMLAAPNLAPNHGTTSVRLAGQTLLVDGCIQHGEPLALETRAETAIEHPAYGVQARPEAGATWMVRWRSPLRRTASTAGSTLSAATPTRSGRITSARAAGVHSTTNCSRELTGAAGWSVSCAASVSSSMRTAR